MDEVLFAPKVHFSRFFQDQKETLEEDEYTKLKVVDDYHKQ